MFAEESRGRSAKEWADVRAVIGQSRVTTYPRWKWSSELVVLAPLVIFIVFNVHDARGLQLPNRFG